MVSINILFWNLNGSPLRRLVVELVREYDVDILILAECTIIPTELIQELKLVDAEYTEVFNPTERLRMYLRFDPHYVDAIEDSGNAMIRRVALPNAPDFLVVAVHLPSKLHLTGDDQLVESIHLRRRIDRAETVVGHARIIVVGDLNMNPFEPGIVSSAGLHAVMDRSVAARVHRTVQGERSRFFYNPIWGRLGDTTPGPPGTYYYHASHISYFWDTFDQVLVGSDLLEGFDHESLKVVTDVGSISLLTGSGIPDQGAASDHLPLAFSINLPGEFGYD